MSQIRHSHGNQTQQNIKKTSPKSRLLAGLIIVVCLAVLVVHWPALSAQAMFLDDEQYFSENLLVQNPSWASAKRFLTEVLEPSTVGGYYQPLTMISLMVDHATGGRVNNLQPFHRTNLGLHIANTALVIVLLYILFGHIWIVAGVGLLFGLHPLTVEPITWVGERKTLLAAFFSLWCLVLYARYARKSDWKLYTGCMVIYVFALLSKPTSTPLPALMLLMDYWPLRRLRLQAVVEKLPLFVLGGISAIITYVSQSRTGAVVLPGQYNILRIPLTFCHNLIFYPYKIIWPTGLSPFYIYPDPFELSEPMVLAGVIGTCILIVLLLISLRWMRSALTGWAFFVIAILPTMQIIGFSDVIASDKFAYLPSVGLLMILASFLIWFCVGRRPQMRRIIALIVILLLAGGQAVATRQYLSYWQDTISLYEYVLKLTPNVVQVHNNLGNALQSQGRVDEAISHYEHALRIKPDHARAHNNLGNALVSRGRLTEAVNHYRQALQINPDYAKAHNNLANVLSSQGEFDEGISHFRRAVQIKPDYAEAYCNMGKAFQSQGRFEEAIDCYNQALQTTPDDPDVHDSLGQIFEAQGSLAVALNHYRHALRSRPDWPELLIRTARIIATAPQPEILDVKQAVRLTQQAAQLTGYKNPAVLDKLAAAYATAGQFDQAIATAKIAIRLAGEINAEDLANQIRKHLKIYEQTRPQQ